MTARVVAVCVVHQLLPDPGPAGVTAIDKRPVAGPVQVGAYGLYADVQADRKRHGGQEKAVYAYGSADARYWSHELGRATEPGWFGENLRIDGPDVSAARIGERWQIGEKLVVQVTGPRIPCQTFARRVGGEHERGWVKRFLAAGRPGAYLRVLVPGAVTSGDVVELLDRPAKAPTVAEVFAGARA